MFVNDERVAVTLDGTNIIYIRPKMDLGTRNRVLGAMAQLDEQRQIHADIGAYLIALAEANIVGWEGPAFDGVPCVAANIRRLDPDNPLVEAVLDEIARRNPLERPSKN